MTSRTVAIAASAGSTASWILVQMRRGSVTTARPVMNSVTVISSHEATKASRAPAATPGTMLGKITLPKQDTTGTYDLQSYEIGRDGKVTCTFEDGSKEVIAQIAVADFANPMGLNKSGETSFGESTASGVVQLGISGQGTRGSMVSGAIEMSNVDLAQEFTNLILAQRGFQASSRVITTSDQVLEELVNIKR